MSNFPEDAMNGMITGEIPRYHSTILYMAIDAVRVIDKLLIKWILFCFIVHTQSNNIIIMSLSLTRTQYILQWDACLVYVNYQ